MTRVADSFIILQRKKEMFERYGSSFNNLTSVYIYHGTVIYNWLHLRSRPDIIEDSHPLLF